MIQLKFRDAKPIYEQVKDGIKNMVYQNVLSQDEKLPSVREMASALAINPNTISRAYKELEQEGFLYTQTGVGTFVNKDTDITEKRIQELYKELAKVVEELDKYSVSRNEVMEIVDLHYGR